MHTLPVAVESQVSFYSVLLPDKNNELYNSTKRTAILYLTIITHLEVNFLKNECKLLGTLSYLKLEIFTSISVIFWYYKFKDFIILFIISSTIKSELLPKKWTIAVEFYLT